MFSKFFKKKQDTTKPIVDLNHENTNDMNAKRDAINKILSMIPENRIAFYWRSLFIYFMEQKQYEIVIKLCDERLQQLLTDEEKCQTYMFKSVACDHKNDFLNAIIQLQYMLLYTNEEHFLFKAYSDEANKRIEIYRQKIKEGN
jgi:hypothetical protein